MNSNDAREKQDMQQIAENAIIDSWARHFARAPHQVNRSHQADAELVEIAGDLHRYLAITIDTIAEEILLGFYRDPYTMGWVTVMATVSDLAAVGADPVGLVISTSLEPTRDQAFTDAVARGMQDACQKLGIHILGGDVNTTPTISLTGCAFGLVDKDRVMMRTGCKEGDSVFITGPAGSGNALAAARLAGLPDEVFPEKLYRPIARLKEGQTIREYASSCMDTSDGLFSALDQLMRINGLGFEIECDWERIIDPQALKLCKATDTPAWAMAAGLHGEFELVFTVPESKLNSFNNAASSQGFAPIRLGIVKASPTLTLAFPSSRRVDIDMVPLRNLFYAVEGNMAQYLEQFRAIGEKWRLE